LVLPFAATSDPSFVCPLSIADPPQAFEFVFTVMIALTAVELDTVALASEKQPLVRPGLLEIVHAIEPV